MSEETAVSTRTGEPDVMELRAQIAALTEQVEQLEDALAGQEFYIVGGYIVTVWPVGDGTYIASCPTLHASVQEASRDEAIESVREAMGAVEKGFAQSGRPMPPTDVENRCLRD